jgi:hypothetical protein
VDKRSKYFSENHTGTPHPLLRTMLFLYICFSLLQFKCCCSFTLYLLIVGNYLD